MRAATLEIDLIGVIDRLLRARLDACAAAGADIEVDRIGLLPAHIESAEMAAQLDLASRMNGVAPVERKLCVTRSARDEHIHRKVGSETFSPIQSNRCRPDDQRLSR